MNPSTPVSKFVLSVQQLSLARSMDAVMKIVREAAREITGADGATFILMENDNCFYADENAISPLWKGSRFPINSCISGWAMKHRKAVIIEDIYVDDRIPIDLYKPTFVKSLAMVPIRTIDPIGAIGNYWANFHKPTDEEITILQSLADFTAIAIENVTVYALLEQRVKDRTAELERANKQLEAFSYSVSHDLKSPLRTVAMYLDILGNDCHDKFDDTNNQLMRKIHNRIEGMQHLIENLLSFFSLGTKEIRRSTVNMKALVHTICQTIKEDEPNRTIEFKIHELPDAEADSALISQVWHNLISNAAKFTRLKENACIEIGAERKGSNTIYSVSDNGSGFDMKYYDKLFAVFSRLHSKQFDGSGVGLAIVQRILEKHNGKVWASSVEDEGATFYFSI